MARGLGHLQQTILRLAFEHRWQRGWQPPPPGDADIYLFEILAAVWQFPVRSGAGVFQRARGQYHFAKTQLQPRYHIALVGASKAFKHLERRRLLTRVGGRLHGVHWSGGILTEQGLVAGDRAYAQALRQPKSQPCHATQAIGAFGHDVQKFLQPESQPHDATPEPAGGSEISRYEPADHADAVPTLPTAPILTPAQVARLHRLQARHRARAQSYRV